MRGARMGLVVLVLVIGVAVVGAGRVERVLAFMRPDWTGRRAHGPGMVRGGKTEPAEHRKAVAEPGDDLAGTSDGRASTVPAKLDEPAAPPQSPAPPEPIPVTGAPAPAPAVHQQGASTGALPAEAQPVPDGGRPAGAPDQAPPPAEPPLAIDPDRPLHRLPTKERVVVLTFDDGPTRYAEEIAAILKQESVPAVFFWLGHSRIGHKQGAALVAAGHQIGTHSMSHARLTKLDENGQRAELAGSAKVLEAVGGAPVRYFRPPYGAYNAQLLTIARELGLITVLWDVDSRDWELPKEPEKIIANVMAQVKPGSIILLHETPQTVQALPALIRSLKEAGYSFRLLPAGA